MKKKKKIHEFIITTLGNNFKRTAFKCFKLHLFYLGVILDIRYHFSVIIKLLLYCFKILLYKTFNLSNTIFLLYDRFIIIHGYFKIILK